MGVIIFIIIVVIQFVVITKGATRISEVAARFTLDAMPGKQMAIDADLNAGTITEAAGRASAAKISPRRPISTGPWTVPANSSAATPSPASSSRSSTSSAACTSGMVREPTGPSMDCLQLYTKLTIGDGLVSQIPAFVISLAAGLIVTRTSSKTNSGR